MMGRERDCVAWADGRCGCGCGCAGDVWDSGVKTSVSAEADADLRACSARSAVDMVYGKNKTHICEVYVYVGAQMFDRYAKQK